MMGDSGSENAVIDLDLNQEPMMELGSLLNELETTHGRIEERIRQLEFVTARARERQRWQPARILAETSGFPIEPVANVGMGTSLYYGENGVAKQESGDERGKRCKRDSTHLVAKALGGGSFFDCNVCLVMAKEPVLTCCGHLFCWACFFQLPYVDSVARECPACNGEVTDTDIIPIYGNGNDTCISKTDTSSKLPPRPRAHRIESIRQQRVTRGVSHIPVEEALRRIRTGIGGLREHLQEQDPDRASISPDTAGTMLLDVEAGSSRSIRSRHFSRVLSISSALNDAERRVEDLETYINDRIFNERQSQFIPVDQDDSFTSNAAVSHSGHQTEDLTTEINSAATPYLSSSLADLSAPGIDLETLPSDAAIEINLTVPHSSSVRRSSGFPNISDVENGLSHGRRRRRLG